MLKHMVQGLDLVLSQKAHLVVAFPPVYLRTETYPVWHFPWLPSCVFETLNSL
jgi:hypothetical protein